MSMNHPTPADTSIHAASGVKPRKPWYRVLYVQVLIGIAIGIFMGVLWPKAAVDMKPFGDGFIKLIKMVITLIIFCTVVSGIAGMKDMKKVGRVGAKSLLYFEIVSTFALVIGLIVANVVRPGDGFNADPATLDSKAVAAYAGKASEQSVPEFMLDIIPTTLFSGFAEGNILQVLLVSVLFGFVLTALGERAKPLMGLVDSLTAAVFQVVNILLKLAPIGAFGAMAFTIGRYGFMSLVPLGKLILTFYATSILFIVLVLGVIARWAGFSIFRFLAYIREEILIVLGTSSSDSALPSLMLKLEQLGCSKPVVGLVVPTGYTFNTDGTSIYMTMAALFVAQATNIHLTLMQQIVILTVAMVTSKGASGVSGASFVALVATLHVIPTIPVAGMALILGIDRFMSEARALTNMIGNGVATVVISKWEKELDQEKLQRMLQAPK
ncbi:MAG TPA: dicarboxylate/amino acid:cation symporter [Steroidobacteraceae bacterium]